VIFNQQVLYLLS